MCEHAGMLNHIVAKLDDLADRRGRGGRPDRARSASTSRVWQLVGALLVGGRTLLVEQEVILDVERFVDTIVDRAGRRAAGGAVVPRRRSSPTWSSTPGSCRTCAPCAPPARPQEGAGAALVRRPARHPAGQHLRPDRDLGRRRSTRCMDRAPDGDRVPLGRPISNMRVYVVDENLVPVPLGAPGLIVFSGVCVGRGYINDPERTRPVFVPRSAPPGAAALPHRRPRPLAARRQAGVPRPPRQPGQDPRLPDRDRRDRERAAAGARRPRRRRGRRRAGRTGSGYLVGLLLRPSPPLADDVLAARLAEALPEYMVPTVFHWRQTLPLTANGKIDRTTLSALAAELPSPTTATTTSRLSRRPSAGWRPRGRPCSACRATGSGATTTSSTAAARRCRR